MILTIFLLLGTLIVFGIGYYLGHQIGGAAHIRTQLNTSNSEKLTTQS